MKTPEAAPSILIVSSSLDAGTWKPVAEKLDRAGHDVVVFETDKVASGSYQFCAEIDPEAGLNVSYRGKILELCAINAAWRRRPNMYPEDGMDRASRLSLNDERRRMFDLLWSEVPGSVWLNSPENMRRADQKMTQLLVARDIGFIIPETIIANNWETIQSDLPEDIALKMAQGVLYEGSDIKTMYTSRFKNSPTELPLTDNPFPGYWQPFIKKAREWRVTVVGENTFDAAIYSSGVSGTDWRRPDEYSKVTFKAESFPVELREKCFEYLGRFALKFGAFDFIEDEDGQTHFLECNPNGQYMWIEESLGFPISQAIADELSKIALAERR